MTASSKGQHGVAEPSWDDPLQEVRRRLVRIHASMAEATNDDPEIRSWSVGKIREVLDYIQSVEQDQRAAASH
jgi:hypothetical protein